MFCLNKGCRAFKITSYQKLKWGVTVRINSNLKKILLLSLASIFALHIQMASAQDETGSVKTTSTDEECVITDDQE